MKFLDNLKRIIGFSPKPKTESRSATSVERVPLSNDAISLEDVGEQDKEGVQFYDTENSQAARGANKGVPEGIDSFGEKDTFDPDEASDHQTYRDRNQNPNLSERYNH